MRRLVGMTTTLACSAALLVAAIGPAAAQTVTPASFTKQVSAAIAATDQTGKASSATLETAAKSVAKQLFVADHRRGSAATAIAPALQTLEQQFFSAVLASRSSRWERRRPGPSS